MTLKLHYQLNLNDTIIGMSQKFGCHKIWDVNKIIVSLNMDCHQNWNINQIEMSLKCNFNKFTLFYNYDVPKIEM